MLASFVRFLRPSADTILAQIGIAQCRSLTTIQQLEISLLPKPFKLHVQLNNNLAKIYDLLVEIRTIRQGIPRRETVLDVLPLRQSLVSRNALTASGFILNNIP